MKNKKSKYNHTLNYFKSTTYVVLTSILLTGCGQKSETENQNLKKDYSTRLFLTSAPIKKAGNNDVSIQLLEELTKHYTKKYTCEMAQETMIFGDINDDGIDDVLFRYSVTDKETQNWPISGWLIAFSNKSNEYNSYIFFDWTSGHCSQRQFDLGFPVSIDQGVISSSIDDYAENDPCCCPSIKRNMTFAYDKEFQIISPLNIENK